MDFEKAMIFFMPGGFRSGKTQGCFLFWKTFHCYSSIKFVYFSAKKLYDYTPKQIKLDYFILSYWQKCMNGKEKMANSYI